jgi:hypothetical protein
VSTAAVPLVDGIDLAEAPLEFWARVGQDGGAWLCSLAARMAQAGALGSLLRFGCPPVDHGRPVIFGFEARNESGRAGNMFLRWKAHHARFEAELEAVACGRYAGRLELRASYKPLWPVAFMDRVTLEEMTVEAGRALLRRLAAPAAWPFVPAMEPPATTGNPRERRRVLIEDEDPAWHQLMEQLCDPAEYEFVSCRGPDLNEGGCPLLSGEPCPKLEWADTVLHSLNRGRPANVAVLAGLQRKWPDSLVAVLDGEHATYCVTRLRTVGAATRADIRSRPAG